MPRHPTPTETPGDLPARSRALPRWLTGGVAAAGFVTLLWLERRQALRRTAEPKTRRNLRNVAFGGMGAAALAVAERPLIAPLARLVLRRRWGLLQRVPLPLGVETAMAVLLLDYTLYLWHVLVHRVPWLWRFHLVHHVDLDLDASTAFRFHFAELVVSVPYRAAQVALIGVSPLALSTWQWLLFCSILFHHSNVRLPAGTERWLSRLIVTPRLHGIHHSAVRAETDSNWSSGLTLWDWLHGTLRRDVPQSAIVIGVPAYRDPAEVTLPKIVAMPFGPERPAWQPPGSDATDPHLAP